MNRIAPTVVLTVALAASTMGLAGCSQPSTTQETQNTSTSTATSALIASSVQRITGEEAQAMMESESDYLIIDVRTPGEYEGGHVPNAINVPLDDISAGHLDALPSKDQLIFLYCQSGMRSGTAGAFLEQAGYTNVIDFGGISSWPGDVVTD